MNNQDLLLMKIEFLTEPREDEKSSQRLHGFSEKFLTVCFISRTCRWRQDGMNMYEKVCIPRTHKANAKIKGELSSMITGDD